MNTRRIAISVGVVVAVAALAVVWSLFRPELLFVNAAVNEAAPVAAAPAPPLATPSAKAMPNRHGRSTDRCANECANCCACWVVSDVSNIGARNTRHRHAARP